MSGHSAPEAAVVRELRAFLAGEGWRSIRMESGFVPGSGSFGEKGMPDWLFIRYTPLSVLWVEVKRPGYKPRCNCKPAEYRITARGKQVIAKKAHECRSCGQKRWAAAERARGAVVVQVSDMAEFRAWYMATVGTAEIELDRAKAEMHNARMDLERWESVEAEEN